MKSQEKKEPPDLFFLFAVWQLFAEELFSPRTFKSVVKDNLSWISIAVLLLSFVPVGYGLSLVVQTGGDLALTRDLFKESFLGGFSVVLVIFANAVLSFLHWLWRKQNSFFEEEEGYMRIMAVFHVTVAALSLAVMVL